ncbi:hypothetical protein FAIPA1_20342 [Frankia sp. AiPs1]|uniref:hypothetical protein n=1 Tax=Frankia sp. AiPa1 TaxID=573492 RepID=UPI00202B6421|nr:hypothetical protein [Frankia sp. AiPa1]MCL9761817.1 hypothetical protein [Frankia sp. AiPa1]
MAEFLLLAVFAVVVGVAALCGPDTRDSRYSLSGLWRSSRRRARPVPSVRQ